MTEALIALTPFVIMGVFGLIIYLITKLRKRHS